MNVITYFVIFTGLFLLLATSPASGQSPLNTCEGMSLSNGAWDPAWEFYHGERAYNGDVKHLYEYPQPLDYRIKIHTSADGNIPSTTFWQEKIPFTPPGLDHTIQVGNWEDGSGIDGLSTSFLVDSNSSMLQIWMAVFLEYEDDHNENVQPKFTIRVSDETNTTIPCGYYRVVAGYNIPGFKTQPKGLKQKPVQYLPWTSASVDLRAYVGKKIKLDFFSYDCSHDGHFGYALFAIQCRKAEITTANSYCPNKDDYMTFSAPSGFTQYNWSTGAITKDITVYKPKPGQKFWVKFKPFSNLSDSCDIYMEYMVPEVPKISVSPSIVRCEGEPPPLVTASVSPGYSCSWSNGATGPITQLNAPGTYTVSATDGYCSLTATVTMEEKPLPKIQLETGDAPCYDSTGFAHCIADTLNTGNYSYAWSNGISGALNSQLPAGMYTVTVSNEGCTITRTVLISQPADKTILLDGSLEKCTGAATKLTAGGGFAYYRWGNEAPGASFTSTEPGQYRILAIDNQGCAFDSTVTVSDFPLPQPKINGPAQVCQYEQILIKAEPAGMATYAWSNGSTTDTQNIGAGTFTVTVTDNRQCTGTATIFINEIPLRTAIFIADSVVCRGNETIIRVAINGNKSDGVVTFYSNLGEILQVPLSGSQGTAVIVPDQSVTFYPDSMVLSDGYACPFILPADSLHIRVNRVEATLSPDTGANGRHITCHGYADGAITATPLLGTPPFTYQWSHGPAEAHITQLRAGAYTLTTTDGKGCTAVNTVELTEPEPLSVAVTAQKTICFNDPNTGYIEITGVSGAQIEPARASLNNAVFGDAPRRYSGLAAGAYQLRVWDGFCPWDTTILFPAPPEYKLYLPEFNDIFRLGDQLPVKPVTNIPIIDSIGWTPASFFGDPSLFQPTMTPLRSSEISLTVRTPEGCYLSANAFVQVDATPPYYAPNVFSPNDDGVNDRFWVFIYPGAVRRIHRFAVFDRWGAKLWEIENIDGTEIGADSQGWDGTSRGKPMAPGVYVWSLDVEFIDGNRKTLSGDIAIVRE